MSKLLQSVLSFDGKDDYIEVPYHRQLSPKQFTLSCWAKVTGKQKEWRSPVTCRSPKPPGGYMLYAGTDDNWQFWLGNGQWVSLKGSNVILRTWTHLAATYDGSKMTLYVNGEQVGKPISSKLNLNQGFPLRIGAGKTGTKPDYFFMGQIAEVYLWNRVRSPKEIKTSMNRRLTGNEAGLVGYWPLNEGSGTTVKDLTGNCQDGKIMGATWKQVKTPIEESPVVVEPQTVPSSPETKMVESSVPTKITGGNTPTKYGISDSKTNFYLVDTNNPITGKGELTGWNIWAEKTLPVQLIIYRKEANAWSIVGKSKLETPVVGSNEFSLATPIKVQQGDFIGIYYPQAGSISFFKDKKSPWNLGNLNGKVLFTGSGADSIAFSNSCDRIYSLTVQGNEESAAVAQPDNNQLSPETKVAESSVLTFDGQKDYLEIPTNPSLDLIDNFTIEAWIKPDVLGKRIVDKGIGGKNEGFTFDTYPKNLRFINKGALLTSTNELKTGTWQHVAVTFKQEANGAKLYINGEEEKTATPTQVGTTTQLPVRVGSQADTLGNLFKGQIAEVRIWNQVRTREEIKADMSHRLVGNEVGLVGYWPLNEGDGNTASDQTAKGNNGTIDGATWGQSELPITGTKKSEMAKPQEGSTTPVLETKVSANVEESTEQKVSPTDTKEQVSSKQVSSNSTQEQSQESVSKSTTPKNNILPLEQISLDEIAKKIASLGLPGVILVIASGGMIGAYPLISALATLGGPFGLIGGLTALGLMTAVGDVLSGYGIESLLSTVYKERSKSESLDILLKELQDLPISDHLKLKLKTLLEADHQ